MNKNLEMINNKNNFFSKLFYKIRGLFKKNKIVEANLVKDNNVGKRNTEGSIINSIKLSNSYKELLELQKKIESDEVSIADISDETAIELIEIYTKQSV